MKKTNVLLKIAGVLMLLIGLAKGIVGLQLLNTGDNFLSSYKPNTANANEILIVSVGLLFIAMIFIISGIGALLGKKWYFTLSVITLFLFIVDGIINGQILFGEAIENDTIINTVLAFLVLGLLYLGQKRSLIVNESN